MNQKPDPRLFSNPAWSLQPLYLQPVTRRWMPIAARTSALDTAFWLMRPSRRLPWHRRGLSR